MITKNFLQQLHQEYNEHETTRRRISTAANEILFTAKKTIFALQKNKFTEADEKFSQIEKSFNELEDVFGQNRLQQEGAYRAAAEEYLEAKTFYAIIKNEEISGIESLHLEFESYLGGLCDLIGELVRYATNLAANGQFTEAIKIKEKVDIIMAQLVEFDFTGYLRTKYDQARSHWRKLEQISYDLRLKIDK